MKRKRKRKKNCVNIKSAQKLREISQYAFIFL